MKTQKGKVIKNNRKQSIKISNKPDETSKQKKCQASKEEIVTF